MTRISRIIYLSLLCIFGLSACGGGGGGNSTPPVVISPLPPSPTDPTTTAEWAALVTRLDIRFTDDRNSLNSAQSADNGPLGGNYYAAARDRFIGYIDSFWNYSYNETVTWNNSSSATFRQTDVAILLDDYRLRWLTFMDVFINSLPLINDSIIRAIRPAMSSSINDGYNDTMRLLEVWLVQSSALPNYFKVEGSWTADMGNLTLFVQPDGQVIGYDFHGCIFDGVIAAANWLGPAYRIIMKQDCNLTSSLYSGLVMFSFHDGRQSMLLKVSSELAIVDTALYR